VKKNLHFMVEIHPEIPVLVSGDPVRLRQILFNLAGNAIKFTDQGIVTLTLSPGTVTGEKTTLVFKVSDTGPGISSEDQDKIFTEFGQGNAVSAKRSEGAGLGLAITSGLVELMGGTMKVTSKPGKGSAFRVELPFEPASGDGVPPLTEKLPVNDLLDGLRILVVDDEAYNRGLLKLILRKYNCEVIEASGGMEAVSLAREQHPDIVLMDIHMPGMSGPKAAEEMQKIFSRHGKEVPVIALSAAITPEEKEKYRQNGIADCISKPFEEEQLLKTILGMMHKTGISSGTTPGGDNPEADRHVPTGIGYNLESLRESCGGNTSFFREMVEMFLKNTETGLKEMEGLIAAGAWDEAAELGHKISAPCRHLKAEILYSCLKQIEQHAAAAEHQLAGSALEQAREEFERIKSDILARSEFKTT
jgi:CheY-like chemotaxis protein